MVDGKNVLDFSGTLLDIFNNNTFGESSADAILALGVGELGQATPIGEPLSPKVRRMVDALKFWAKDGTPIFMRGWLPWCDKIAKVSVEYNFDGLNSR